MSETIIIKTILVDDAPQARELLRLMLKELAPHIHIAAEAADLKETISMIKKHKPDLIFLDIEMPGKSGLQIMEELPADENSFDIIFTTAYNEYAIQAFRLSAIDYLLKPIRENELLEAIKKAVEKKNLKESLDRLRTLSTNLSSQKEAVICIPQNNTYEYIPVNSIEYIEADGSYAHLFLADGKRKTVSKNLKHFEDALKHLDDFVKIHRSVIINLNFVSSYNSSDRGSITLKSGKEAGLSRSYREGFLNVFRKKTLQ